MIALTNARLAVQIQEPGSRYKRSRFAWSGICEQITLDGECTFCSQEAVNGNPGTEGIGLSDEFGMNTPLGYDEIEAGEWFPKIGVGFLQKTEAGTYDFMKEYPIRPSAIQVKQGREDQAEFWQVGETQGGWGWKYQKAFSLDGQSLSMDYALENTGEKIIRTETYNHNFLRVGAYSIGPEYELWASFPFQLAVSDGPLKVEGHSFQLTEIPSRYVYAQQPDCGSLRDVEWRLTHRPSGHGVRVAEHLALHKFALWGMSHVISPEFFTWIEVQPGETQTWKRRYTFF